MRTATAESTASIRIDTRDYGYRPERDAKKASRYIRYVWHVRPRRFEGWPGAFIQVSDPGRPEWLQPVQLRIRRSILPQGLETKNDGRWLSEDVAEAALEFFQIASDLLPGEPFIYSSRKGDLVAEFEAPHGTLTSIISPGFSLLYASIDDVPTEEKFLREEWNSASLRNGIRKLTSMLATGRDGAVEPTN